MVYMCITGHIIQAISYTSCPVNHTGSMKKNFVHSKQKQKWSKTRFEDRKRSKEQKAYTAILIREMIMVQVRFSSVLLVSPQRPLGL